MTAPLPCVIYLRCDPIIICSRILRHWNVNNLFNDATACMDNEMSCYLTRDLMARLSRCGIVSACHECKKKLKLRTRRDNETEYPSPHNEARRSWTCRHSSGEMSRATQLPTRSELCVHRDATLDSRIPSSCSIFDLNSWILLVRSACELIVRRQKQQQFQNGIKLSPNVNSLDTVKFVLKTCVILRTTP